jgi:hypothetical protein
VPGHHISPKIKIAAIANNTTIEMKTVTREMNSTSTKLVEMTTKYKDTLTQPPPSGEDGPRIYLHPQPQAQGERKDKIQENTTRH